MTPTIRYWSPPEWAKSCFPLPEESAEILTLDWLIPALDAHLGTVTEADTTALAQVLHVGHMLVTMQGADCRWPASFNARTGETVGDERTFSPVPLFRRLNALLDSTEFDHVCRCAQTGGYSPVFG